MNSDSVPSTPSGGNKTPTMSHETSRLAGPPHSSSSASTSSIDVPPRSSATDILNRESFTIVSRPTTEDVVSVHGSFPDDGARELSTNSMLAQLHVDLGDDASERFVSIGAGTATRPLEEDPSWLAEIRANDGNSADDSVISRDDSDVELDMELNEHTVDFSAPIIGSNKEMDSVYASTVMVESMRASPVDDGEMIEPVAQLIGDDDEMVDISAEAEQPARDQSPDRWIQTSQELPTSEWVEDGVIMGWQDATSGSQALGSTNTGTVLIAQPAGEIVNAVYDVAADLNRRISNWWHSHHPDDVPAELSYADGPTHQQDGTCVETGAGFTCIGGQPSSAPMPVLIVNDNSASGQEEDHDNIEAMGVSAVLPAPATTPVRTSAYWLLGRRYVAEHNAELPRAFRLDFYSRIWCSYRSQFVPIGSTELTSDAGWGCMMRTGQSLFAQALLFHHLGRAWRRGAHNAVSSEAFLQYAKILSWFHDSPKAPFSLHRITQLGEKHGKQIGEWFGPFTVANVLCQLNEAFDSSGLHVHVAADGVIYRDQLPGAGKSMPDTADRPTHALLASHTAIGRGDFSAAGVFRPTLFLVAIRLGIENLNSIYHPAVKMCLAFPQSVGIAGGRPDSSLYFVGFDGDDLFYLDPHCTRATIKPPSLDTCTEEDFATYHCPRVRRIRIQRLDPCMLIGFYCRDRDDFDDFCRRIRTVARLGTPVFTVESSTPKYGDDIEVMSASETDSIC